MELTDLARDLPTTREDVLELARARAHRPSNVFEAVQTLVDCLPAAARQPRRSTAAGRPDFEL